MDAYLKTSIWRQFEPTILYLERTMRACPDHLWCASMWDTRDKPKEMAQVWYVAYHALFWLDLYLTGTEDGFLPPAPFALIEQYDDGPIPERVYTKDELLAYLDGCRQRCYATIQALTEDAAERNCAFGWGEVSFFGLLIYNLRHVQEHSAQINMLLGQNGVITPDYPTVIKDAAP
ncbi:MAG: DinB family protein [Anaerolinea sp.]|nr:DinB family protein [Anaerolinea sp.]